jgi:hypothetical protein
MDDGALVLLRLGGYILNIFLLSAVVLRYRHHVALLGLIIMFSVSALAALLRYWGEAQTYFLVLDFGFTPLLYLNALLILWMLVSNKAKPK